MEVHLGRLLRLRREETVAKMGFPEADLWWKKLPGDASGRVGCLVDTQRQHVGHFPSGQPLAPLVFWLRKVEAGSSGCLLGCPTSLDPLLWAKHPKGHCRAT